MGMTLTCWIVGWLLGGPEVRIATFQTEAMTEGILTPARDTPLEGMLNWVANAATGIELLAVVLIVGVIAFAPVSYSMKIMARQADMTTYTDFRHRVGRALLLGLEILVAADIIRTVCWSRPWPTCWFW